MVSDKYCWVLVSHAIDWEYRLLEDDFDSEEDFQYAAGSFNGYSDAIEQLRRKDGINAIIKAKNYMYEEGRDLVPIWLSDEGYEPNPRFTDTGNFTSISTVDERDM